MKGPDLPLGTRLKKVLLKFFYFQFLDHSVSTTICKSTRQKYSRRSSRHLVSSSNLSSPRNQHMLFLCPLRTPMSWTPHREPVRRSRKWRTNQGSYIMEPGYQSRIWYRPNQKQYSEYLFLLWKWKYFILFQILFFYLLVLDGCLVETCGQNMIYLASWYCFYLLTNLNLLCSYFFYHFLLPPPRKLFNYVYLDVRVY